MKPIIMSLGLIMIFQLTSTDFARAVEVEGETITETANPSPFSFSIMVELKSEDITPEKFETYLATLKKEMDSVFAASKTNCSFDYFIKFKIPLLNYPEEEGSSLLYAIETQITCAEAFVLYWNFLSYLADSKLVALWADSTIEPMPIVSISSGGSSKTLDELLKDSTIYDEFWKEIDFADIIEVAPVE